MRYCFHIAKKILSKSIIEIFGFEKNIHGKKIHETKIHMYIF